MKVEELKFLKFEEFITSWLKKAKNLGKKKNVKMNAEFWLLNMQNFLEFFFLEHLQIEMEDAIEFGYVENLKKTGEKINSKILSTSLIFCSANSALYISNALKADSYEYALELYEKNSTEHKYIIQEIVSKYKNNFEKYGPSILDNVDDFIIMERLKSIRNNFEFRETDYKEIKKHLTTEFDSSLVFDFKQLYNTYSIFYNIQKAKGEIL